MASFEYESGRQFETDPISGQIFFREPIEEFYSPWRALEASDYHAPRPASHNVGIPPVYLLCADLQFCSQMFAHSTPLTHSAPYAPQAPPHAPPCVPGQAFSQTQGRQALRTARRATRTHNPIRGQGVGLREGGKGQGWTRGAANYRPREIKVLLDLVEEDLPVGAKGWNGVGARFREWAAMTEYPSRTDRSLEVKFKQV